MNDEDSPPILTEITGAIAVVRLNRPAERNPLSVATLQDLKQTTLGLFSRADIQAVIFTGTGNVFSSGANIRELVQLDTEAALRFSKFGQDLFQTIADSEQLTLAAINGYCIGGGLDLALACDIRVASMSAVFSHPGARLGIITGWGGTQRLRRIIKKAAALELMLTARPLTSREALALGLVTHVSSLPLQEAMRITRSLLERPFT